MSGINLITPLVVIRNVLMLIIFFFGCLSIVWTQFVFIFILDNYPSYKQTVINLTKRHFIQLITFVLSVVSPTTIAITFDSSSLPESNSFQQLTNGVLSTVFSPNSVMISNHQIYTDWTYLWFLCYTSRLADYVYIIMKDMSKTPILGYGMTNFNFMFLSRKWEVDKPKLTNQLLEIDANARGSGPASGVKHVSSTNITPGVDDVKFWPKEKVSNEIFPFEILLYPEGTVPSLRTTKKSREFCAANGLKPLKHVLLPRTRGLFLVLKKLKGTIEVVYDITTGYHGLKPGEFGEDLFTLKKIFILGKGPEKISYHFRSFRLDEIPLGDDTVVDIDEVKEEDLKKFEDWLYKIWYEKDELMAHFYKYGAFVSPKSEAIDTVSKVEEHTIVGDFKLRNIFEVLSVFSTSAATIVSLVFVFRLLKLVVNWFY